jgi:hypothetical protein
MGLEDMFRYVHGIYTGYNQSGVCNTRKQYMSEGTCDHWFMVWSLSTSQCLSVLPTLP